jgi:hypothetical protein
MTCLSPALPGGFSVAVSLGASAFAELSIPNWAAVIAIAAVLRKRRRSQQAWDEAHNPPFENEKA